MSYTQDLLEKSYSLITDEGETRACEAIPDAACTDVPRNFFLNIFNGASTKLAEQLASPGVVLPWILSVLAAPAYFVGFLIPIKDAGSLLPQLLVSAKIRSYARRKWFWIVPALVQAICLLGMAAVVAAWEGFPAGIAIVALLLVFSFASGVASVAFKDVMGKTIPKGKRGQVLAYRATLGGVLTLVAGVLMYTLIEGAEERSPYLWLLLTAAVLWVLAAVFFVGIVEEKGATEGGRSPVQELKEAKKLFKQEPNLRRFIFTRGLLMAVPLAQPLYVLLGKQYTDSSIGALAIMVVAVGIAGIISSPFWGRFADKSSRKMMLVVAAMGIGNAVLVLLFPLLPEDWQNVYTFVPLLLLNVMVHGGARLSRKTYLVDMAPKDERPLYVSLSNTIIGLFTLLAAALGMLAELISPEFFVGFLALLLALSMPLAYKLEEI